MKKLKYLGVALVVLIAIVAMLFYNKKQLEAKNTVEKKEAYYVTIDKVTKQKLQEEISFVGTVAAYNDVNIVSETQGKVTAVYVKIGDHKQAGSALIQVDDELKKASFNTAEANYIKSKKDYERFQVLYKQNSTTEAQLDQAKLAYVNAETQYTVAKRQLTDTKISAPISGTITSRNVDMGTMIQPGMVIGNIVDISRLKVKVSLAENDAFRLKTGDPVNVTTEVYPGVTFKGRVESISAKGDDAHTYPVEITISNDAKSPMRAGMFARVNFNSLKKNEITSLPRTAILGSIKNAQVYVVENGISHLRKVVLGSEYGTSVEILGGLQEGETVVVSGQNTLVDNVKVTVIE